jgi:uncharacterized surface protein with fasciclin (FAS1) repeats
MRNRKLLSLLALLLTFGLIAAACSDDSDDSADDTTADTEETTESTESETTDTTESNMTDSSDTAAESDIVDTAVAAGDFTTLATALEAAGLVETLKGEGPYTVFAPTDAAFEALPPGTLDQLLADPEALADVLLYHVVEGEVLAEDVVGLDSATTVNGADVTITVEGDSVRINDALVTMTDIMTSNGVIHVIDAVLIPPTS